MAFSPSTGTTPTASAGNAESLGRAGRSRDTGVLAPSVYYGGSL
jgi:hypothetical protein